MYYIKRMGVPRERDGVPFCYVFVSTKVLVGVSSWVVIVGHEGERPSRQDVFAVDRPRVISDAERKAVELTYLTAS